MQSAKKLVLLDEFDREYKRLQSRHGTGSLGRRVNGSFGSSFQSGSPGPRVIIMTQCATRFFYFKAPFCSLPYVCRVFLILILSSVCTLHCTAVSIRSSKLSCVLHKPRLKAFRKRKLILALSLWDNWPAKESNNRQYNSSENYMQCILHHETDLDILTDLVSTSAD